MVRAKVKNLFRSRTFWLAVIQGVLGVLIVVMVELPGIGGLVVAKSVLDVALRLITGEPVEVRLR